MWFNRKHRVGLVLGGGGARGFFHMGVIKAIQELEIKIEEISGTSIGAVVGVIYAANPKINFEEIAGSFDFLKLVQAMVAGGKNESGLEKMLKSYIKVDNFEDLKIRTRVNATDINNNKEVVFEKGEILTGLIASIAIPGVFPPVKYGDNFLVDGGVFNNIPIPLIRNSDRIIVSDISGPIKKIDEKTLPADVLYSAIAFMQRNNSLQRAMVLNKDIIYLNLEDKDTFILDFRKKNYKSLIDLGYETVMKRKEEILRFK
jgi:NTE family protein